MATPVGPKSADRWWTNPMDALSGSASLLDRGPDGIGLLRGAEAEKIGPLRAGGMGLGQVRRVSGDKQGDSAPFLTVREVQDAGHGCQGVQPGRGRNLPRIAVEGFQQ